MSVREIKPEVYRVRCPICGEVFYATSESNALTRLDAHLLSHHTGREEVPPCAREEEGGKE